jgi:4-hydroxythreonine-4-phosphate dehydrogenase
LKREPACEDGISVHAVETSRGQFDARVGFDRPRIALVCLNPHAGDGGNFDRNQIDAVGR